MVDLTPVPGKFSQQAVLRAVLATDFRWFIWMCVLACSDLGSSFDPIGTSMPWRSESVSDCNRRNQTTDYHGPAFAT